MNERRTFLASVAAFFVGLMLGQQEKAANLMVERPFIISESELGPIRGFAQFGLVGEQDLRKILDTMLAVQKEIDDGKLKRLKQNHPGSI